MNKIWKIIDIVNWGSEFFLSKDIDSPRLTIELILCEALNLNRLDLYSQFDKPLSDAELALIKQMSLRKAKREPLQQIFNKAHFMDLELFIDKRVLSPRPETELLVEKALIENKGSNPEKILDIGCGSGCIAIALAKAFPTAKIDAIDISGDALEVAKINAERHALSNINFIRIDILQNGDMLGEYDIIVSNPPYIPQAEMDELQPEVRDYEPKAALTDNSDGLTFYRNFSEKFKFLLKPNGRFYLEFGFAQKEALIKIFDGFNIEINDDYARIPRILSGSLKVKATQVL